MDQLVVGEDRRSLGRVGAGSWWDGRYLDDGRNERGSTITTTASTASLISQTEAYYLNFNSTSLSSSSVQTLSFVVDGQGYETTTSTETNHRYGCSAEEEGQEVEIGREDDEGYVRWGGRRV